MTTASPAVQEFFRQYAGSRGDRDVGRIASQYPEAFMLAGPTGVRVTEKPALLAAFPKAQEFLTSVGHQSTEVLSLEETAIDQHYVLVRAKVVWRFQPPAAEPIDVTLDSMFILYADQGGSRIVFQLEHEDFWAALRARGVLPAQS